MKSKIILSLILLIPFNPLTAQNEGGVYVKIRKHTDTITRSLGKVISSKESYIEMWISSNTMAVISGEDKYIVDTNNNLMTVINTKYKTFIELPLPLDISSHLDEYALLRYQTYRMRFYVYGYTTGSVQEQEGSKTVLGRNCRQYEKIVSSAHEDDRFESETIIWASPDISFDLENFNKMNTCLHNFLEFNYSDELRKELKKINGFPLLTETTKRSGRTNTKTFCEVIEIEKKMPRAGIFSVPADYVRKDKISHYELVKRSIGPQKRELNPEKREIFTVLKKFQEGFTRRDTSIVEEWIDDLMDEDIFIVGTHSTFPGRSEWTGGREAAISLFRNDWIYWGNVKMYLNEAEIQVYDKSGWVSLFATVTRKPGMEPRYRNDETIRRAVLNVLNRKMEQDWSSRRKLLELIYDASWALVEYERSPDFTWPIRITLGLIKTDGKWLMKQMHWSHPGEGYPIMRLLKRDDR